MSNKDFFSSFFWILCSALIILGSLRLQVGEPQNPGPGFLPLLVGALMGICSTVLLLRAIREGGTGQSIRALRPKNLFKLIGTLAAILSYVFLFPLLGFIPATIILMIFLFKAIGEMGWKTTLAWGISTSIFMYLIFKVWLMVQFPIGLWGL